MATISTTLTLIDKMSTNILNIQNKVNGLASALGGLGMDVENAETAMGKAEFKDFKTQIDDLLTKLGSLGDTMTATLTLPGVLLGKKMYSASVEYESAMANVEKTTGATAAQMDTLNEAVQEMVESMPIEGGFEQAAGTMAMAAQLGVQETDDLIKFTQTYEKLVASTNISGESGAADVAQFLNVVEGGVQNVDRFASTIVELGNNFATDEDAILAMAKKMAAAGELAGFSTSEILALATALTSVGINAEAGGSAAGKLMKQMQSAAEVGILAQEAFTSGFVVRDPLGNVLEELDFQGAAYLEAYISDPDNFRQVQDALSLYLGGDLVSEDYVYSLLDAWFALEDFSEMSGKTAEQFAADWASNPAQGMLDFFYGLSMLDASGQESAIAAMERMGISEIRLSNLVAAMAGNPDLFKQALGMAYTAYAQNIALDREYGIFESTQASQNQMLKNKWENTLADLGDNLVEALNPVLETVNGLLESFNGLSEVDQDKIIGVMEALVITGPGLTAISKAKDFVVQIGKLLATPAGKWMIAAAGITAIGVAIANAVDPLKDLTKDFKNIEFSFDQASVDAALAQIAEVQAAKDLLEGGETTKQMQGYSAAVQSGHGTVNMFNSALAYESAAANKIIDDAIVGYSLRMQELEIGISRAQTAEEQDALLAQYDALNAEMEETVAGMQADYAETVSGLFNGMIGRLYPNQVEEFNRMGDYFDLLQSIYDVRSFDAGQYGTTEAADAAWYAMNEKMFSQMYALRDMDSEIDKMIEKSFMGETYEEILEEWVNDGMYAFNTAGLMNIVGRELEGATELLANTPMIGTWLATMLNDDTIMENLDLRYVSGELGAALRLIDFQQAVAESGDIRKAGGYITEGLAEGMTEESGAFTQSWDTVRAQVVDALQAAFVMHSPSQLMAGYGIYLPQGLAEGAINGQAALTAAMHAVANAAVTAAASVLNLSAGSSIGMNFAQGMIQGMRSKQAAVTAAARSLANSASAAARSALSIHSPSRVTQEIGEYFGEGFIDGMTQTEGTLRRAARGFAETAKNALADRAWKEIELFSGLENEQFLDEDAEIHLSESDVRRMRELAEREVVNTFTTAKLNIDFTANNNINSNMDLDGVVSYLEEQLTERLEMAAEGVYS